MCRRVNERATNERTKLVGCRMLPRVRVGDQMRYVDNLPVWLCTRRYVVLVAGRVDERHGWQPGNGQTYMILMMIILYTCNVPVCLPHCMAGAGL